MKALGLKVDGKVDLSRDQSDDQVLKTFEEKAKADAERILRSGQRSKLFASYYEPLIAPNFGDDKVALYKQFGFYWPTHEDLTQLLLNHPNFKISDLILEKIAWKR